MIFWGKKERDSSDLPWRCELASTEIGKSLPLSPGIKLSSDHTRLRQLRNRISKVACPILKYEFSQHCLPVACWCCPECCACSRCRAAVYHQAATEHPVARTPQWVLNVWHFWYAHVPAKASTHLMKQASSKQINLQGAVRGVSRTWLSHLWSSARLVSVVSPGKDCQTQPYRLCPHSVKLVLAQTALLWLHTLSLSFTSMATAHR